MKIMKRRILILLLLFISVNFLSYAQYSSVMVGVIPFFDSGKNTTKSSKSKSVVSSLTNSLFRYKFIKLVERSQMDKLLSEVELGMTGMIDEETAAKVGKVHGIQIMVLGNIHGDRITGRAVHVETHRIISSASVYGISKVESLGRRLASGIEVFLAKENLKELRNDSPDIDLEFWVNRISKNRSIMITPDKTGRVKIGERVVFKFKSNIDGYLTIVDIQPGGDVVILFPNEINPSNRIEADKEYSIPSRDDEFEITVCEPAGIDTLIAYFTKRRVNWLDMDKLTGEGFRKVKKNEKLALSRGFKITATRLKRADWESKVIEIYVIK